MSGRWKTAGKCECGAKLMVRLDKLPGGDWWDAPPGKIGHPHKLMEAK